MRAAKQGNTAVILLVEGDWGYQDLTRWSLFRNYPEMAELQYNFGARMVLLLLRLDKTNANRSRF